MTDVVGNVLGWATVRIVVTFTRSTLVLGVMLGVSGVLVVLFVALLRVEQRVRTGAAGAARPVPPGTPPPVLLQIGGVP